MKKQKCPFEGVYDLFAIRVILDSEYEKEKQECWQVYSIVTDMYQPNPNRLRDWLSVPKSNGYESLHITVMGPQGKWVEVQIRTERMDAIAERGLAAHWRYKGIKQETGLDTWLTSVREALETADSSDLEVMDQFKMDLYEDEVFVFTPKGDLYKLPKGATVLDFAFLIHTKLGCSCIGAKVNGKNVPIKQVLHSGDQVEIMTQSTQTPKQGWLNYVVTSKARVKIKQALKEMAARQHTLAKEELERKMKNRKIEWDESIMMQLIKRMGYKIITDFYQSIANGTLDVNQIIDQYVEQQRRVLEPEATTHSAEEFTLQNMKVDADSQPSDDVLVIDQNVKGLKFQLAKCCNPIYGDDIFGFVSVLHGIKIHRTDCPNAKDMRERYGYRIVKARWAGKSMGKNYPINLKVVGNDDIGILTNITSVINKEEGILLRSVNIDAHDGLFSGTLTVLVSDTSKLDALIKKLRTVKGVKQVSRN
jgi:GTP pyrophosphokinase